MDYENGNNKNTTEGCIYKLKDAMDPLANEYMVHNQDVVSGTNELRFCWKTIIFTHKDNAASKTAAAT